MRSWRFLTLMLAALGLTMGAAHALELWPKRQYDAAMYAAVTSTLYRFYGLVGGVIQVAALFAAAVLAWLARGRPAFRPTLAGAACLGLSLALWFALVQPVNSEWLQVIHTAPESVPEAYARLRERWEYGHLAAFLAWLTGLALLLRSVVMETP